MSDVTTATPEPTAPPPDASQDVGATSEPKIYGGDHDSIREATADHQRNREAEAKENPPPPPERVAKAKQTLAGRVAERMGVKAVDLDQPTLTGDEPTTPLKASRALAEYREAKAAETKQVLDEMNTADADAAESEKTYAEYQAQVEQETKRQEQAEQQQRQQQAAQQVQRLSAAEHQLATRLQAYNEAAAREVPELLQIARLNQTNPALAQQALDEFGRRDPRAAQKLQRFEQLEQAYQAEAAQAQLVASYRQQQEQDNAKQRARAGVEQFRASHPELADDQAWGKAQEDLAAYLKDGLKLSNDQIDQLHVTDPSAVTANGLATLYGAAKQFKYERMRTDGQRRGGKTPPVMRPGAGGMSVNGMNGSEEAANLRRIETAPTMRKQIEAAKEAVLARRAAPRRRA
jgi:hypothetical protein